MLGYSDEYIRPCHDLNPCFLNILPVRVYHHPFRSPPPYSSCLVLGWVWTRCCRNAGPEPSSAQLGKNSSPLAPAVGGGSPVSALPVPCTQTRICWEINKGARLHKGNRRTLQDRTQNRSKTWKNTWFSLPLGLSSAYYLLSLTAFWFVARVSQV